MISFEEAKAQYRIERLAREELARKEGRTCRRCGEGVFSTPGMEHQQCARDGGCLTADHYCGEGEDTLGEGVFLPPNEPMGGYY